MVVFGLFGTKNKTSFDTIPSVPLLKSSKDILDELMGLGTTNRKCDLDTSSFQLDDIINRLSIKSDIDYKDALLNSLYAQVDYLRKDSLQKTAIITTLIKNKVNNSEMIENTIDDNLEPAIRHTMNLNSETENKMPSNVSDTGNNPEMIENTIDDNLEPVIRHTMNLNTETENKIQSHVSDTANAYKHDSNDNVTKSNINRGLESLCTDYKKISNVDPCEIIHEKNYVNDSNDEDVRDTNNIETRNIFDVLTVNDCDQGNQGHLNNDDIYSNISITSDDESSVQSKSRKKNKKRSIIIISDSMTRGIRGKKLAEHTYNQHVYVKTYGGAKVGDMKYHAIPSMKYHPNHIIFHMGTNEIRTNQTAEQIAKKIIKVCDSVQTTENAISVSGLIYRNNDRENSKVDEINHCLLGLCSERGYYFLDNSNISRDKLNWDGLHLNKAGDAIFFNNLLKHINY